MKTRSNRHVRPLMLTAIAGSLLAFAAAAQGQSSWAAAVNGSWFDATKWNPMAVPNAAGTNVTLGLVGPYTTSMQNGSATCGTLTISNPAAILSLVDNATLNVAGNISDSGLIQISGPGAPGNTTRISAQANISISGSGTLRLAAIGNGDSDSAYLYYTAAANTLTNAAGHTVAGDGRIYTNFINNGSVNADVAGKYLMMIDQPKTNNATMTASNTGALQVRGTSLTQGASGVCLSSNDSPIQFVSTSVSGGTLNGAGTGSTGIQYYGACSADSVTMQNLNAITDNSHVDIGSGGVVNNGTWTVSQPSAPGNLTYIQAAAPAVTVGGSGTIRLQGVSGGNGDNDSAYLYYTNAANVLTNGASHSIKGYGRVYTNLVNNGSVNADVPGKYIMMIDQPKTNNGTMTASNGGAIQFRSVSVTGNPAAQIISTDSASPVQFVNATISGGGFNTSGTGVFQYYAGDTLSNLTVNGTHQITDNSVVNLNTNLVNNGNWLISTPAAPGNLTRMSANAGAVAISGTGTIRLQGIQSGNGDNNSAYLDYGNPANVLTLGANQQLLGYGRVFTNLVNNGTINADNTPNAGGPASKGIYLIEQPKTNNATITSSNGGYWYFRSTTLTNSGLLSSSNTTTPGGGFESCTVNGGTITNIASQPFGTAGTVAINASTLTPGSQLQVNDNTVLTTTGLTNNGTIFISNPGAPGNLTRLHAAAATTTLLGSGTLRLRAIGANGDNDSAYLYYTTPANQLVNSSTHSIKGQGRIYANVVNNGLIEADQAGKGLFFIEQPKTNNATITSSGSGFWYVRGCTLTNTPTGVMSSSNTTTPGGGFESCTIVGGSLTNTSGQSFGTAGSVDFDGVTITPGSSVLTNDNTILRPMAGGIVNNGTIFVQRVGGAGNLTRMFAPGASTISGTGVVRLQAVNFGNDSAYLQGAGDAAHPLTLGPGQTLSGTGRLYGNIVSQGRITPDQPFGTPGSVGQIGALSGSLVMAASSAFDVQAASATSYDNITGNDVITQAGALTVIVKGAYVPAGPDLLDIVTGSSITGRFNPVGLPPVGSFGPAHVAYLPTVTRVVMCYANCDGSNSAPVLNVNDFGCFLNAYAAGDPYANCDQSTTPPVLNVNDFGCFLNKYAAGCP